MTSETPQLLASGADAGRGPFAEMVLPCVDLDATLAFFTEELAFRLAAIQPADAPRFARLEGYGTRLRLERSAHEAPTTLHILFDAHAADATEAGTTEAPVARELVAPNGTRVVFEPAHPELVLPVLEPTPLVRHANDDFELGRAGMLYRDLIPGRQGGRFIASHIRIPDGGPVADDVHFHRVAFQVIYCRQGWVRVLYEDQGAPFVLQAGDCVLQPPGIRHRVLESSSGLEVVELASPAEHETIMDPDTTLPSANTLWERSFDGQTFVHHRAEDAAWTPSRRDGFEVRDTGIAGAAAGRGGVRVVRASEDAPRAGSLELAHDGELLFYFVLSGEAVAAMGKLEPEHVGPGDALTTPASTALRLSDWRRGLELLEIALPATSGAF